MGVKTTSHHNVSSCLKFESQLLLVGGLEQAVGSTPTSWCGRAMPNVERWVARCLP